jgi:SAM-dependent methyltransferase
MTMQTLDTPLAVLGDRGKKSNYEAYQEVPYDGCAHRDTHPANLAVVAAFMGLATPSPARCRFLEIGCAEGDNLIPMAALAPDAEFVGIDLADRHIEQARAKAQRIRLRNVSFAVADLSRIEDELGSFDYIVAHGVYSWLPDALRPVLQRQCARMLTPNGVAYISHNVYPGWHRREALRYMMLEHVRGFPDARTRIAQGRALLDFLAASSSPYDPTWKSWLEGEAAWLKDVSDSYIFHEFLAVHNRPTYFTEFIAEAREAGLQFVADASLPAAFGHLLPEPLAVDLANLVGGDRIAFEQYHDFLLNRPFRKSVLARADAPLRLDQTAIALEHFHVLCSFERAGTNAASLPRWVRGERTLDNLNTATDALLDLLASRWPESFPVVELFDAYRSLGLEPAGAETDLATFCDDLFRLATNDVLYFNATPIVAGRRRDRPATFGWVRDELAQGRRRLTSVHHQVVTIPQQLVELARLADGTRDLEGLGEGLIAAYDAGAFKLPVESATPEQIHLGLRGGVERGLRQLRRLGLLQ